MGELEGGLIAARIRWDEVEQPDVHPFDIPAIRATKAVLDERRGSSTTSSTTEPGRVRPFPW